MIRNERYLKIIEAQGWDNQSLEILLFDFIKEKGLEDDLIVHLLKVAEEENESDENEPDEDE